jgi:hypothetical protein
VQLGKCLLLLLQGVRILLWLLLLQRYYRTAPGAQILLPLLIRQGAQLLLLLQLQGAHMLLRLLLLLLLQSAHMLLRLLLQGTHMLLLLQGAYQLVLLVLLHSARSLQAARGLDGACKLKSAHRLHYIAHRLRLQGAPRLHKVAPRLQGLHSLQQVLRLACVELAWLQRASLVLQLLKLHQLHPLQLHRQQLGWQHLCWQWVLFCAILLCEALLFGRRLCWALCCLVCIGQQPLVQPNQLGCWQQLWV